MSTLTVPEPFQLPELNDIDLHEITLRELRQYYTTGRFASSEYVSFCIEAIQKVPPTAK